MPVVIGYSASYDEERVFFEKPAAIFSDANANLIFLSHQLREDFESQYIEMIDALVIGGGNEDIAPGTIFETPHDNLHQTDPIRDQFELNLIRRCYERGVPIFGICRGAHLINIALGGTIYQDIETQFNTKIDHLGDWHGYDDYKRSPNLHDINISSSSFLYTLSGLTKSVVNSYHHQAIKALAPGLTTAAWAQDGLVEAFEGIGNTAVFGVQWHPELMESDRITGLMIRMIVQTARDRA